MFVAEFFNIIMLTRKNFQGATTLFVNIYHPDLRNGKITIKIADSLLNIRHCQPKVKRDIYYYSKIIYCYWIFLFGIVMVSYLSFVRIFTAELSLLKYLPIDYFVEYPKAKWYLEIILGFLMVFLVGYSTMIPVSFGLYVTYHEWVQFRLLNDYLKRNLWQNQHNPDLFNDSEQMIIYKKIKKAVKWHLHLKRYV